MGTHCPLPGNACHSASPPTHISQAHQPITGIPHADVNHNGSGIVDQPITDIARAGLNQKGWGGECAAQHSTAPNQATRRLTGTGVVVAVVVVVVGW